MSVVTPFATAIATCRRVATCHCVILRRNVAYAFAEIIGGVTMKLPRRKFLHLGAGAAVLPAVSRIANAQAYPSRPVHLIVGFAAGGAMDINARLMGQWLSERLGQQFAIENRTGAGGNIATEAVVRAPPDGYTLLTCGTANAVSASLYERLGFNFIRDVAPVAGLVHLPLVLIVNPSVPTKTAAEFIAYAKANPGKLNFASSGNGASEHLAVEQFKIMTGVDVTHVPYRGGAPALTALLGGQVQAQFAVGSTALAGIKAGMRPLAVTTATRWAALPDVPTLGETVPGYDVSVWYGVGAPKNTPSEIIEKLNKEINAGLADPKLKAQLSDLGGTPFTGSPGDFGKFIADETEKWAKVVKSANIKAE
jgi:tripartite-type tricarboxylate transporter receptor subunit TctC